MDEKEYLREVLNKASAFLREALYLLEEEEPEEILTLGPKLRVIHGGGKEEHDRSVKRLMELIDKHRVELVDSLEELGCGGRCDTCPAPEGVSPEVQVRGCLHALIKELGLSPEEISGE